MRFALEHGETQAAGWMLGAPEAPPQTLVQQVDAAVRTGERERLPASSASPRAAQQHAMVIRPDAALRTAAGALAFFPGSPT